MVFIINTWLIIFFFINFVHDVNVYAMRGAQFETL
jgi:hypothetical protein